MFVSMQVIIMLMQIITIMLVMLVMLVMLINYEIFVKSAESSRTSCLD